jgi:hypothetical protein
LRSSIAQARAGIAVLIALSITPVAAQQIIPAAAPQDAAAKPDEKNRIHGAGRAGLHTRLRPAGRAHTWSHRAGKVNEAARLRRLDCGMTAFGRALSHEARREALLKGGEKRRDRRRIEGARILGHHDGAKTLDLAKAEHGNNIRLWEWPINGI